MLIRLLMRVPFEALITFLAHDMRVFKVGWVVVRVPRRVSTLATNNQKSTVSDLLWRPRPRFLPCRKTGRSLGLRLVDAIID